MTNISQTEVHTIIFSSTTGETQDSRHMDGMDNDTNSWTTNSTLMPFLEDNITKTWDVEFWDSSILWAQIILIPIVVLIGMVGNMVTIYVLTRKQMQTTSNIYLTSLAISDFIFLVFSFSMSWKHYDCMQHVRFYWQYVPFGLWIRNASSYTSVLLTVSFTVERYIAVCHPLMGRVKVTGKRAKYVSCFVSFICFLLTCSIPFEWKVEAKNNVTNEVDITSFSIFELNNTVTQTVYGLQNTDLGKNSLYRLLYHLFIVIVFFIVPLVILAIMNGFLIHAVKESRRKRDHMTNSHLQNQQHAQVIRREDRITITLILVVIVFIICQVPTALLHIYTSTTSLSKHGTLEENILIGLENICSLLGTINATCNFILYNALSGRFRKEFSKAHSSNNQSCGNSRDTQMEVIYFRRDYM